MIVSHNKRQLNKYRWRNKSVKGQLFTTPVVFHVKVTDKKENSFLCMNALPLLAACMTNKTISTTFFFSIGPNWQKQM